MTFQISTFLGCVKKSSLVGALALGLSIPLSITAYGQTKEYVVFSIEGVVQDLALGQILTEGHKLDIPENASVNLIGKQGEIITIKGPTVVTVTNDTDDEEGEKALTSISELLFDENKFVNAIGGTRSTGEETNVGKLAFPNGVEKAWTPVLSSNTETYCVKKGAAEIYRETSDEAVPLLINGEPGTWEGGNEKLNLDGIAFQDSESPVINLKINDQSLQIFRFDKLNLSVASQVAWLAHKGCKGQALQLLASKIPSKPSN